MFGAAVVIFNDHGSPEFCMADLNASLKAGSTKPHTKTETPLKPVIAVSRAFSQLL